MTNACKEFNIKVIAYCIMDNHAHFLINVEKIEKLSKLMHKINSVYARYYNYMKNGRKGYVFRDRYLSEPITSKRYLIQCIKYIHMNPVKAKIVLKCEEYKYSSYNIYIKRYCKNQLKENGILSKADYEDIINNCYTTYIFSDTEEYIEEKISNGVLEFIKKEQINPEKIFLERSTLIELIKFLKNVKKIKYVNIKNFFNITRGTMENITKKIRENN